MPGTYTGGLERLFVRISEFSFSPTPTTIYMVLAHKPGFVSFFDQAATLFFYNTKSKLEGAIGRGAPRDDAQPSFERIGPAVFAILLGEISVSKRAALHRFGHFSGFPRTNHLWTRQQLFFLEHQIKVGGCNR